MAKLCYKIGGIVKKYDLKDNANKPRLTVKSGGMTKYLGLSSGSKSGELSIRVGGQTLHVQTWGINESLYWKGLTTEPFKGMGSHTTDTRFGGLGLWVLVNEDNYPVVVFGRLGADKPDTWARATWVPNIAGTSDATTYPDNFTLTSEQVQHPKRLKGNIRLATTSSAVATSKSGLTTTTVYVNGSPKTWYYLNPGGGDRNSTRNNIIIADIISTLKTKSSYLAYSGPNQSNIYNTYAIHLGYGYQYLNTRGVHWPDGTEEADMGSVRNGYTNDKLGIDSEGFKVSSPIVSTEKGGSYIASWSNYDRGNIYTGISSASGHVGAPYIDMSAPDDDNANGLLAGWLQRDVYVEYPYAYGEDTNPNDYFTFSPKQVLDAFLNLATELGIQNVDYGFARGRNYV